MATKNDEYVKITQLWVGSAGNMDDTALANQNALTFFVREMEEKYGKDSYITEHPSLDVTAVYVKKGLERDAKQILDGALQRAYNARGSQQPSTIQSFLRSYQGRK